MTSRGCRLGVVLTLLVLAGACAERAASVERLTIERAVREVLDAQQAAWNRGDVDAFMAGYADDGATTFVSGDAITRGWRQVLEDYRRRYPTKAEMGTLTFSDLTVRVLTADLALVDGAWRLERTEPAGGRFTLLFDRGHDGWRIIHDTTTSARR